MLCERPDIDASKVAWLIGIEEHFAAGVGGDNGPKMLKERIGVVDAIIEQNAGLSRFPCLVHYLVKELPWIYRLYHFFGFWIAKRVRGVRLIVLPEVRHDEDRDVEIAKRLVAVFGRYELLDVGMVRIEDAHVRTPSNPSLLD